MAIRLIEQRTCDLHAMRDEEVYDDVQSVVTDLDGSGPHEYELCAGCRTQYLEPLKKVQDEHGRPPRDLGKKKTPTTKTKVRRNRVDLSPRKCWFRDPDTGEACGREYDDRKRLRDHARKVHGVLLSEVEGNDPNIYTPFVCPECYAAGKKVAIGQLQALSMHRWRKHQVPMTRTVEAYGELSKRVSAARKRGERYYPPDFPFETSTEPQQPAAEQSGSEDEDGDPAPQISDEERRQLEQALSGGAEVEPAPQAESPPPAPQQSTGTDGPSRPHLRPTNPWAHD